MLLIDLPFKKSFVDNVLHGKAAKQTSVGRVVFSLESTIACNAIYGCPMKRPRITVKTVVFVVSVVERIFVIVTIVECALMLKFFTITIARLANT
jgi:hypothetical protein